MTIAVTALAAHAPAQTGPVDFAKDVRPIFQTACLNCHGPEKQKSGLRLDSKAAAFEGGESGPAIVPGHPDQSLLLKLVRGLDPDRIMPAKGERLTPNQIAAVAGWIDAGAKWPDGVIISAPDKRDLWSLRPISRPAAPDVSENTAPQNDIDHFILARLQASGLQHAGPADKRTLLRRLYFDLIGLPPTPAEVTAFLKDDSADAYERIVDRLLASPRFGERWARHWLDVVRYADSQGFEMNQPRASAWPYRDWVIKAIDDDMPYDQFVMKQLAGDVLGPDEDAPATGFLVAGPYDEVKSPDPVLTAQQRADELHDIVSVTGAAFLGLTVGCARCHDHKFDPIPQTDYYRMVAIFAGTHHGERESPLKPSTIAREDPKPKPPIVPTLNEERFAPVEARIVRFTITSTNDSSAPCLDEVEIYADSPTPSPNLALASSGAIARASGALAGFAIHKIEHLNDGQYGNSHSWISNEPGKAWIEIELPISQPVTRVRWSRDREGKFTDRVPATYKIEVATDPHGPWTLVASSADHAPPKPPPLKAYIGRFDQPKPTHRLDRGDPMAPREEVTPGALAALSPPLELTNEAPESQRRLVLARWLTNPANPLTARVIVNRLWQHHFGAGLVSTPSDFGHMGGQPTHPQLLDYLANELIQNGWHLKPIHRLIVTSAAYRQSSVTQANAMAKDANDTLLWRYPPQRLEAETLRDTILALSGKLDLKMGGHGFELFKPDTNYVHVYAPKEDFGPAEFRRMIYAQRPRLQQDSIFGAFDCPDGGQPQPRRSVSTTPLQALNLLNSNFILQQSRFWADGLKHEAGDDPASQTKLAFEQAFSRPPADEEVIAATDLIKGHGLAALCRALFNANELLYVH